MTSNRMSFGRREFLGLAGAAGLTIAAQAAARALGTTAPAIPRGGSFEIETGALDPRGGHIQGAAASPEALYLSQMTQLAKFDWSGRLLKKLKVISHTGDLCWHAGHLYTSVAVYGGPNVNKGMIQVFDSELNLVRETLLDRKTDGITLLDGTLYLGMGSKTEPSKEPHRVNIFGRFDPLTLKEIAPRQEVDYGYETHYGAQNILTDGASIFVNFYAVKGGPPFAAFDKDLKALRTFKFGTGQGADFLPLPPVEGERLLFTTRTTGNTRAKDGQPAVPPGGRIQFYRFNGDRFTAAK